jgi:2,4-dienoyl-CoA reductase-like NADH-dependent reductase (Old Yellow Enzyme family)
VIGALDALGLAYLHFIEPRSSGAGRAEVNHQNVPSAMQLFRPHWRGVLISAGGFDGASAEAAVAAGYVDAFAFGRYFISNPDLPARIKHGVPFAAYNRATFYGAGRPDIPTIRLMTSCREHSPASRTRYRYQRRSNPARFKPSAAYQTQQARTLYRRLS